MNRYTYESHPCRLKHSSTVYPTGDIKRVLFVNMGKYPHAMIVVLFNSLDNSTLHRTDDDNSNFIFSPGMFDRDPPLKITVTDLSFVRGDSVPSNFDIECHIVFRSNLMLRAPHRDVVQLNDRT